MRTLLLLLTVLVLSLVPAFPQATDDVNRDLVVRQSVDPATGAVVGQHVALYVDVLFKGEMPHPPRVALADIPGAQVIRFETQAMNNRETIGGESYVGQRFEFALYARRGGSFTISPAAITLLARDGTETGTTKGEAVTFDVTVPPGVDASGPVVATRSLTLDQAWDPDPGGSFAMGDAIVRTITRSAEDVPGLAMRDLEFVAPQGIRVYVDPPTIDDHSDRGVVTGRRLDRVTYVFETGGSFDLPALQQPWWNLDSNSLESANAAGVQLSVPEAAASDQPGAAPTESRTIPLVLLVALAAALAAIVAYVVYFGRSRRVDPERDAFDALRRTCASGDATTTYAAYSRWRDLLPPSTRNTTDKAAEDLDLALFGGRHDAWSQQGANDFLAKLETLRRSRPARPIVQALTPLNPKEKEPADT